MGADAAMTIASAFACGALVGATLHWMAARLSSPYGKWLGCTCWVRPISRPRWRKCVVVAVSWRGAICVREADKLGEEGYWIKKQNVRYRVLWREPDCARGGDGI